MNFRFRTLEAVEVRGFVREEVLRPLAGHVRQSGAPVAGREYDILREHGRRRAAAEPVEHARVGKGVLPRLGLGGRRADRELAKDRRQRQRLADSDRDVVAGVEVGPGGNDPL